MATKFRFFIDRIGKISPATKAAQARSKERYVSVTLASGDTVRLDMKDKRSNIRFDILNLLKKNKKAVYVKTGVRSDTVTDLLIPFNASVRDLTATASGDIIVEFVLSAAPHYLKPGHPDFKQMKETLETAKKKALEVQITETQDEHEIIHVQMLDTKAKGEKAEKAKGKLKAKKAPVSFGTATTLFNQVSGLSCVPDDAVAPCITFMYPDDGCYARAHEMCRIMIDEGATPGKIWIHKRWLNVDTPNHPSCGVTWRYHVAPTLEVTVGSSTAVYVIDPSMFSEPVHQDVWTFAQGDDGASIYHSGPEVYYLNDEGTPVQYDDDYSETDDMLTHFRVVLMTRSASDGPPPYATCFKPDIFVRDNLQDTGLQPTIGGGISRSPDICHYRNELADPQATLGSEAAESRDDLFENIEFGQPNYIYVRMQNRGLESGDADIDLYWTRPSTLPTPASWNPIDTLHSSPVSVGEFKVVGPAEWNTIPAVGHYCFIAVISNTKDPSPDVSSIVSVDDFYKFVRQNNNVCWKNFDIEDLFGGSQKRFDFQIQGWPRQSHPGDLELDLTELPAGTDAELRILKRLTEDADIHNLEKIGESTYHDKYSANVGLGAIRNMPLRPSDNSKATIVLTLPEDTPDGAYEFSVIQKIDGLEMGRITKRLVVGQHPYVGNRKTKEVHVATCDWAKKMSSKNKVAYQEVQLAIQRGYNGCRYCLTEYDTD